MRFVFPTRLLQTHHWRLKRWVPPPRTGRRWGGGGGSGCCCCFTWLIVSLILWVSARRETEAVQPNEILFCWMTQSSTAIVAEHTHTNTPGHVLLYLRECMTGRGVGVCRRAKAEWIGFIWEQCKSAFTQSRFRLARFSQIARFLTGIKRKAGDPHHVYMNWSQENMNINIVESLKTLPPWARVNQQYSFKD